MGKDAKGMQLDVLPSEQEARHWINLIVIQHWAPNQIVMWTSI